jgi:ribonucleoside-diphosphate reductase alpha chain
MTSRQTLPNRRRSETLEIEHAGHRFALSFSRYEDGRTAEVFLSSQQIGSPLEAIARDAAVTVSIALQHGAPLSTIYAALTKDHDGGPATLLGSALAAITEASR